MLANSIHKAFGNAERMVTLARTKAAGGFSLPGILASGESGSYQQHSQISHAAEQYRHNRGWVHACVSLVANRVAGQMIHLAKQAATPDAGKLMTASSQPRRLKGLADNLEPLDSHPLLDLLADPWELGTAFSLLFVTVASLELTGRSLWYVSEANSRKTIFPIPTSWIEDADRKRSVWKVRIPGIAPLANLPGESVVHFHYPNPADPWGVASPLGAIAAAVTADEAIGEAQWKTFSQGQFPGVVLTAGRLPPGPGQAEGPRPNLTPEQRKQLIESIRGAYSGVHKLGEPLILDGLIEAVTKISLTPQELDFLNSAKLTKNRILQGFRVSPILLGEVEGANRASATVADEIFCANKINPLITLLSQSMTQWLGPMFARGGEKLTIWIEEAKAHDPELKLKQWSLALSRDAVDADEYRVHVLNIGERKKPAAPAAADPATPPAEAAPATADVQATALNGAQIDSLLKITNQVTSGEITPEAAKQLIAACFPLLPTEQITGIVDNLKADSSPPAIDAASLALAKAMNPYTREAAREKPVH